MRALRMQMEHITPWARDTESPRLASSGHSPWRPNAASRPQRSFHPCPRNRMLPMQLVSMDDRHGLLMQVILNTTNTKPRRREFLTVRAFPRMTVSKLFCNY